MRDACFPFSERACSTASIVYQPKVPEGDLDHARLNSDLPNFVHVRLDLSLVELLVLDAEKELVKPPDDNTVGSRADD